uniref:Uncharacterized protein n=1 Tax=Arion vulgaris TaxID=1028688 RepID=A0A0B7BB52_9EUPU
MHAFSSANTTYIAYYKKILPRSWKSGFNAHKDRAWAPITPLPFLQQQCKSCSFKKVYFIQVPVDNICQ